MILKSYENAIHFRKHGLGVQFLEQVEMKERVGRYIVYWLEILIC